MGGEEGVGSGQVYKLVLRRRRPGHWRDERWRGDSGMHRE